MDELKHQLVSKQAELADVEAEIQQLQDVRKALARRIAIIEREIFWRDNPGERLEVGEELVKSEAFYQQMEDRRYGRALVDDCFPGVRVQSVLPRTGTVMVESTAPPPNDGSIGVPLDVARTMKRTSVRE